MTSTRAKQAHPELGRLLFREFLTSGVETVWDTVEWEIRDAEVVGSGFEQKNVEFPKNWSQNATNIVAQKYFRGQLGTPQRETSVKQMIGRVADTITGWGVQQGYFRAAPGYTDETLEPSNPDHWDKEAWIFNRELTYILLHQLAAFNSPVWFNVGFEDQPQCSACFILSVKDTLSSILEWNTKEGKIFQGGSGSGVDLSPLRGCKEPLSKGGYASGPVSFMRGPDAWAGTISSGGKTRRAAKMVTLRADHPDVMSFITCKALEEERLAVLAEAGLVQGIDETGAFGSYQNANNTVRVTDEFMRKAVGEDKNPVWNLLARSRHNPHLVLETVDAPEMLNEMAKAAWRCADPGVQFDTLINEWHTCPVSGRINSSNPCSEYMHIDDSACNLASINVLKFRDKDGHIDVVKLQHVTDVMITAMDILVEASSYPTPEIAQNAHDHHQLGLGMVNLGALLMADAIPYDSSAGRDLAGALASLICGRAYKQGSILAAKMGPYKAWEREDETGATNGTAHINVLRMHSAAAESLRLKTTGDIKRVAAAACTDWQAAQAGSAECGQRFAQATVMAPTGTISFLMDCDTTGIEPGFDLVQYKNLAGGGSMVLVNKSVDAALTTLGVSPADIKELGTILKDKGKAEFLQQLKLRYTGGGHDVDAIFAGANDISVKGHIKMLGAIQPFVSGAISKTINMAASSTWEDVRDAYVLAWREGAKAVAIYRDGSKGAAPLSTTSKRSLSERRRLPETRDSKTHKFTIGQFEGYITVGLYEDGTPGEVFLADIGKDGSTLLGMVNAFATQISYSLQYGMPLEDIIRKHVNRTFEPRGITRNPEIPTCTSVLDYMSRWLASMWGTPQLQAELGLLTPAAKRFAAEQQALVAEHVQSLPSRVQHALEHGPACHECGSMMQRAGTCYVCRQCGADTGCG